jgi:hypothetical protein
MLNQLQGVFSSFQKHKPAGNHTDARRFSLEMVGQNLSVLSAWHFLGLNAYPAGLGWALLKIASTSPEVVREALEV